MNHRLKTKIGKILISMSLIIWIVDRLTHVISTVIGRLVCGDKYLCPVDGVVGDCSCGFNTDIYLSMALLTFFILGILLILSANKTLSLIQ